MMKQIAAPQTEQTDGMEQFVLDEAAWAEVAGGNLPETENQGG